MEILFQIGKELAELRARVEKLEKEKCMSKPCSTEEKKIRFYLHVCSHSHDDDTHASETIKVFGNTFNVGFSGEIKVNYSIVNDSVCFEIPELGYKPKLGGASHIVGVVIRICDSKTSVQAICDDVELTMRAACCNAGGCSCYAPVGCSC